MTPKDRDALCFALRAVADELAVGFYEVHLDSIKKFVVTWEETAPGHDGPRISIDKLILCPHPVQHIVLDLNVEKDDEPTG